MRVITGEARGRKLKTLDGLDVRPTTDRVKEGLFNIIQFDLPFSRFLDLFGGSGQIGIEALSRGAEYAVFVDESRAAQQVIKENLQSTGFYRKSKVVAMEAKAYLSGTKERFQIAFLDPPYSKGILQKVLPGVPEVMAPGGIIICEHLKEEVLPEEIGAYVLKRVYAYGRIRLSLYREKETGEEN
ncbi:16S rRNA (guanine(966)-N(2))-methyltransferase RsmD [Massiliimalia massiliensis]|jgi:16S rRNA (guanine966-N2)-methyltransferase|uniref:16S rRNA (guanine(966)-N(2))-methyltransferase RsmD n=1 Tax=Massiliimalia massiliensis TaxID=1852384 RepID=UPI0009856B64|nr:16S rRNA (guanine(966)-N(2))-methyltransferase RsmD [Massiliimalia massiliensis]